MTRRQVVAVLVAVPTLTITVNKDTRQIIVDVQDWEGVSPGMLLGLDIAVQKAIHQWGLKGMLAMRQEVDAADLALKEQAGSGRVTPESVVTTN